MIKKMAFVIRDQDGGYLSPIAFTLTSEGWLYSIYTGITTGFTCYTKQTRVQEELHKLNVLNAKHGFGKRFVVEYIDLNSINRGKIIINNIYSVIYDNKKINFA